MQYERRYPWLSVFGMIVLGDKSVAYEKLRVNFNFPLNPFPVVLNLLLPRHVEVLVGRDDLRVPAHRINKLLVEIVYTRDA